MVWSVVIIRPTNNFIINTNIVKSYFIMLLIKQKLFYQLIGIASVIINLPLQIGAQPPWVLRTPTYVPTYTPTAVETDDVIVTSVPTLLPTVKSETTTLAPSTKSTDTVTSSSAAGDGGDNISVENLSCPQSFSKSIVIDSTSTLSYSIVLLPDSSNGIFCAKLTAEETKGWIGLGISPNGQMANSVAIVGLPNDNTVLKYALGESRSVNPMSNEQQTLRDASISQLYGATVLTFTKVLVEDNDDELPILINGDTNYFIHARGSSNSLGYHAARMSFEKRFGADDVTVVSPSSNGGGDSSTMGPTRAPSKMASVDNTPAVPPSTMDPVPVPSPPTPSWNDRPYSNYTSSPIYSSTSLPPTITTAGDNNSYGDNGYDFVLPGDNNNDNAGTVSSMKESPTSSGVPTNLNGLVPIMVTVTLISSYFMY